MCLIPSCDSCETRGIKIRSEQNELAKENLNGIDLGIKSD